MKQNEIAAVRAELERETEFLKRQKLMKRLWQLSSDDSNEESGRDSEASNPRNKNLPHG